MTISLTYLIIYTRGVAKGIALGGYSMRRRSQPCLPDALRSLLVL
ncbi:MAG: hypothetical protein V7K92_27640 [Nostoc sp.]